MSLIRLDRLLSDMGIATRKEIKQIVRSGRVSVGGVPALSPDMKLDAETSCVTLDGRPLAYRKFRYFAMDKPAGIITASTDKNARTVLDLLPPELKNLGLFPVGRLDKETTGLLLLTNDGEFAHRVISPKYGVKKRYLAETDGITTPEDAGKFSAGLTLRDGLKCMPALLETTSTSMCTVTVEEGKYHQVRRMLASVGKPVISLRRLSAGGLELESLTLKDGVCELTEADLGKIFN